MAVSWSYREYGEARRRVSGLLVDLYPPYADDERRPGVQVIVGSGPAIEVRAERGQPMMFATEGICRRLDDRLLRTALAHEIAHEVLGDIWLPDHGTFAIWNPHARFRSDWEAGAADATLWRALELQADRWMVELTGDPEACVEMFRWLEQQQGVDTDSMPRETMRWGRNAVHPPMGRRIQVIEEYSARRALHTSDAPAWQRLDAAAARRVRSVAACGGPRVATHEAGRLA